MSPPKSQLRAVSDGNVLIAKAVAADAKKHYATALVLYRSAIETLLEELSEEQSCHKNPSMNHKQLDARRKQRKATVKDLLRRAEQLHSYLATTSSFNSSSSQEAELSLAKTKQQQSPEQSWPDKSYSSGSALVAPVENDQVVTNTSPDNNCNEKEWSFKFVLHIDVKSRIKVPPSSSPAEEEGNLASKIAKKCLRWFPIGVS